MRTYLWIVALLVAAVVLVGGVVAWFDPGLLLPAGTEVTRGVRLYGYRMAARNLALAVGLGVVVLARWGPGTAALLGVVALVEVGDTVTAIISTDWASGVPAVTIALAATLTAATVMRGGGGTARSPVGHGRPQPDTRGDALRRFAGMPGRKDHP